MIAAPAEGAAPAVVSRSDGAWDPRSGAFRQDVRGLAAALVGYGLGPGGPAAVLGAEGSPTMCAGLAVIAAGAALVPLDPAWPDEDLLRALASTACVQAIASDEKQLARILALRPDLPALDLILLATAEPSERKPAALLVDSAIAVGSASLDAEPRLLERCLAESEGGPACTLVGPKGAAKQVSREALIALAETIAKALEISPGASVLAALPVGGVDRLAAALAVLSRGATLLLPDPAERADSGLDQRPADSVLLDAGGLEMLHRAWLRDIESMSWLTRVTTRWAVRQGRDPKKQGLKHRIAESLGLGALRAKLGGKARGLDIVGTRKGDRATEAEEFFSAVGLAVRYHDFGGSFSLAR